jgi:hypothetical protein
MVFKHGVSTNAVQLPLPLGEGRGEGDVRARTSCFRIILTMPNLKCFASGPTLSLWERKCYRFFMLFFNNLKNHGVVRWDWRELRIQAVIPARLRIWDLRLWLRNWAPLPQQRWGDQSSGMPLQAALVQRCRVFCAVAPSPHAALAPQPLAPPNAAASVGHKQPPLLCGDLGDSRCPAKFTGPKLCQSFGTGRCAGAWRLATGRTGP